MLYHFVWVCCPGSISALPVPLTFGPHVLIQELSEMLASVGTGSLPLRDGLSLIADHLFKQLRPERVTYIRTAMAVLADAEPLGYKLSDFFEDAADANRFLLRRGEYIWRLVSEHFTGADKVMDFDWGLVAWYLKQYEPDLSFGDSFVDTPAELVEYWSSVFKGSDDALQRQRRNAGLY